MHCQACCRPGTELEEIVSFFQNPLVYRPSPVSTGMSWLILTGRGKAMTKYGYIERKSVRTGLRDEEATH